mgnify:FL=1
MLAAGGVEPEVFLSLNKVREIFKLDVDAIRGFFYNLDFQNQPFIKSEWLAESGETSLRETHLVAVESNVFPVEEIDTGRSKANVLIATPTDVRVNQFDLITKRKENDETIVRVQFSSSGGGAVSVKGETKLSEAIVFLPSTTTQEPTLRRVAYLKENRLEGPLLELLQKIDSRIVGIEVINERLLVDVKGTAKLMPLGLLGDGLKKAMSIMATIIGTDSSTIVIIDEIENGLHYSVHKELWKDIITIISRTRAQVFVTTHNIETLKYLQEVLEDDVEFQPKVRCYNIARTKKAGFKAYKYTYKDFESALEMETEIRN